VTEVVGSVAAVHRFPVKSMSGERLESVEVSERGLVGDRSWAVVDRADGKIATGKHPQKWSKLVQLAASYTEGPGSPVTVTFPDGSTVRSDGHVDEALSRFLGRDVALVGQAHEGQVIEEVWPRIDGLAPFELVESMSGGREVDGDPLSDNPVASMAPPGTFFDLTTLSVMTTATLRRLAELEPEVNFDPRRYRANVLVEVAGAWFAENDWAQSTLQLGPSAEARVDIPTMRCVMTTLARDELAQDRRSLHAIARHNRLEVFGGRWACAGVYATVTGSGTVSVGDTVLRASPEADPI
jgi:uncharacterized protein YcbX